VVRACGVLLVVLASGTAWAAPRVQVAPFAVRGEALGYFGPEVARAVAAALEGAGVETGPGAEATITGHVEELTGDRVRLSASLRGRTLTAEGPLEAADAVATQLANQIAPLLLENDPAAQKAAEKRARDAAKRAAAVPPSRPAKAAAKPAAAAAASEAAKGKSEAAAEPKSSAPAETKPAVSEPKGAGGESASAGEPKPEPKPAEAQKPAEAKGEGKAEAKPEAKPEPPKSTDWVPPRVDAPPRAESPPTPPAPPSYTPPPYYVRGRVVAHAIANPPTSYPSAGVMATQALFSFLHRRMRLSVIPTGVGITSAAVASDEAYRAAARAVVMARLESVEYMAGPSARVRLDVVVVRDGRQVMRRVVESAPSDPNRRSFGTDPIYQAVTMALEALVPELVGALADVR
jgi:hypothetical protein